MENLLKYSLVISGLLLFPLFILSVGFKTEQFNMPEVLTLVSEANGYIAVTSLTKGKEYGVVIGAKLHRNKLTEFRKSISMTVNSQDIKLEDTNYLVANNSLLQEKWVNKTEGVIYYQEYIRKFVSPLTCNDCTLFIKGHTPQYLDDYVVELHEGIDESYYWFGYMAMVVGIVFMFSAFSAIIFLIYTTIKQHIKELMERR